MLVLLTNYCCTNDTILIIDVQLEEGVADLKEEDMGVVVLMYEEDPIDRPPHSLSVVRLLHPRQPCSHRGVLLQLCLLFSERVVLESVEGDSRLGPRFGHLHARDWKLLDRHSSCCFTCSCTTWPSSCGHRTTFTYSVCSCCEMLQL